MCVCVQHGCGVLLQEGDLLLSAHSCTLTVFGFRASCPQLCGSCFFVPVAACDEPKGIQLPHTKTRGLRALQQMIGVLHSPSSRAGLRFLLCPAARGQHCRAGALPWEAPPCSGLAEGCRFLQRREGWGAALQGQIAAMQGQNTAVHGQIAAGKCNLRLCMRRMQRCRVRLQHCRGRMLQCMVRLQQCRVRMQQCRVRMQQCRGRLQQGSAGCSCA